jgi:class 3 adenylate cyclase
VALQLRVGLNSGQVIAGDTGSGSLGYAAAGESVGTAQRMEAVAPPSGGSDRCEVSPPVANSYLRTDTI